MVSDRMNIERFHNKIEMRLGYERIVGDKRITIAIEAPDAVGKPELKNMSALRAR